MLNTFYACPQASEPLATFFEYMTYGHMIDNVVLIVTGTLHERGMQVGEPDRPPFKAPIFYNGVALNKLPAGVAGQVPPTWNV